MEQQSTIHKAVKTTNLGMVLPTLVAILLLLLLAVGSAKPLFNHFAGPFDITSEELVSINDPKDTFRTYVTVRPDFALDTTFYYYETQDDSSEKIIHSSTPCNSANVCFWQGILAPRMATSAPPSLSLAGSSGFRTRKKPVFYKPWSPSIPLLRVYFCPSFWTRLGAASQFCP